MKSIYVKVIEELSPLTRNMLHEFMHTEYFNRVHHNDIYTKEIPQMRVQLPYYFQGPLSQEVYFRGVIAGVHFKTFDPSEVNATRSQVTIDVKLDDETMALLRQLHRDKLDGVGGKPWNENGFLNKALETGMVGGISHETLQVVSTVEKVYKGRPTIAMAKLGEGIDRISGSRQLLATIYGSKLIAVYLANRGLALSLKMNGQDPENSQLYLPAPQKPKR